MTQLTLLDRIENQLWAEAGQDTTQEDIDRQIDEMTVRRFLEMVAYMGIM